MEVYRNTLLAALNTAIKEAEKNETRMSFTGPSAYLSVLRDMFDQIQSGEYKIILKD
mgnify:CR=1 FL=1